MDEPLMMILLDCVVILFVFTTAYLGFRLLDARDALDLTKKERDFFARAATDFALGVPKMHVFTSYVRSTSDKPWEELCWSEDGDEEEAETMCRMLAAEMLADRLRRGIYRVDRVSTITVAGAVPPLGVNVGRRRK